MSTEDDGVNLRLRSLEAKAIEFETRFGNGREVMGEMKQVDEALKKEIDKLKPKAPDWLKVGGAVMSILLVVLSGHYWIINQLRDRPTDVQMEKIMREHAELGHRSYDNDINQIRTVQGVQAATLTDVKTELAKHGDKLDDIIKRLPLPRGKHVVANPP